MEKEEKKLQKQRVKEEKKIESQTRKQKKKEERKLQKEKERKRRGMDIRWDKLDNTAHLFPVIAGESMSNVYRISVTLNEEVQREPAGTRYGASEVRWI